MSEILSNVDLKSKWGAFPVWVWGALLGALALGGYFVWRRAGGGGTDAAVASQGGATLDAAGYNTSGMKGGSASNEPAAAETNQGWVSKVSRSVADSMGASPTEVYAALYKYVTGQAITVKEQGYVDKGIQLGTNPPEGTQGVSDIIPNVTPPSTNRQRVTELLTQVFGRPLTDSIAKSAIATGTAEGIISNLTNQLDNGASFAAINRQVLDGPTRQAWIRKGSPA